MSRLPVVGGDVDDWGGILTDFLSVSLNADGSLKGDSLFMHKAGAETATGGKLFTGGLSPDTLIISVKQQGAVGDGASATADTAAFTAAINAINASANGGVIIVETPPSTYNITSALPAFTKPVSILGGIQGINVNGTMVTFGAGLTGLDFTAANAAGSRTLGLRLKSLSTGLGTDDGIRLGSRTTVDYCQIEGFGRDGLNADSSGTVNCNTCGGIGTRVVGNWRHGIFIKGPNSNVHVWNRLEAFNNKAWGIFNVGLYNNTFINPLCDGNGATSLRTPLSVADAVFNGTTTVTSATAAFATTDVGAVLLDNASGTLVPAPTTLTQNGDTTVAARVSATQITMSQAAVGSGSGKSLWIVAPGAIYDASGGSTYINPYVEGPHNGNWVCLNGKYTDWQGDASAVIPITDATHFVAPNYWNFYQRVSGIGRMLGAQLYQAFQGDQVSTPTTQWALGPGGGSQSWGNFTLFDYISGQRYFEASGSLVGIGLLGATPVANKVTVNADVDVATVGKGLQVKEGTNAKMGVATLVGGTVTVANTSVTTNSRIFLTCQTPGGTPGFLRVSARTAGTSFTILSSSGTDTSVVAWLIMEPG
jgi:hypothetical protein